MIYINHFESGPVVFGYLLDRIWLHLVYLEHDLVSCHSERKKRPTRSLYFESCSYSNRSSLSAYWFLKPTMNAVDTWQSSKPH